MVEAENMGPKPKRAIKTTKQKAALRRVLREQRMPRDENEIVPSDAIPIVANPVPRKDVLTCNFMLHHEHPGEQPESLEVRFSDFLESDEQPLRRRLKLGVDWQPINPGFTAGVGELVLVNHAGAAERAKPIRNAGDFQPNAEDIIEVSMGPDCTPILVRPGRFTFLEPADISKLRIRAQVPDVPAWLYVYPQ